jgi:hypothetical protein
MDIEGSLFEEPSILPSGAGRLKRARAAVQASRYSLGAVRRIALLSLVLFALALLAGCGSASDQTQEATLTPAQVRQTFERATGRPLEPAAVSDPAWDQLGFGLDMPQSLVDRYGIFNVYVGKPGKTASLASFFKDKDTEKPLARSSDGVYWELDSQSKTWVAYKRYSGNVVLVWFSGSKEQAADERFDRLDSILSGLPG